MQTLMSVNARHCEAEKDKKLRVVCRRRVHRSHLAQGQSSARGCAGHADPYEQLHAGPYERLHLEAFTIWHSGLTSCQTHEAA